jgi:hypothetical protein
MVTDIRPEELFWVIKNGVKMTAMPSFGADNPPVRDKNIWAIVAFLVSGLPSFGNRLRSVAIIAGPQAVVHIGNQLFA